MGLHIAVDIGGTQLRAALYDRETNIPKQIARLPTQGDQEAPLERLLRLIGSIWPRNERVAAIGLAAPGPIDPYSGILFAAPNIPGWENLSLRQHVSERFQVPVMVGNDANLAAVGEWKFGAGRGHNNLIYLTISTGIGGGVILDGRLLLGYQGLAAELGHVTVLPGGPMCGCGHRGHLEAVASGTGIAAWVNAQLAEGAVSSLPKTRPVGAFEIRQAAEAGDSLSITAFQRAGRFIGEALADYLHIFNPSLVVFGGGVSRSGDLLFVPMRQSLAEGVMSPQYLVDLELTTAQLGDEAGLLGALALARELQPD